MTQKQEKSLSLSFTDEGSLSQMHAHTHLIEQQGETVTLLADPTTSHYPKVISRLATTWPL